MTFQVLRTWQKWKVLSNVGWFLVFKKKPIQASSLILGFKFTTQGIEYLAFEKKQTQPWYQFSSLQLPSIIKILNIVLAICACYA
jgi:hypothetical protein